MFRRPKGSGKKIPKHLTRGDGWVWTPPPPVVLSCEVKLWGWGWDAIMLVRAEGQSHCSYLFPNAAWAGKPSSLNGPPLLAISPRRLSGCAHCTTARWSGVWGAGFHKEGLGTTQYNQCLASYPLRGLALLVPVSSGRGVRKCVCVTPKQTENH